MENRIITMAQNLQEAMVSRRRDIHCHAESAWTEFRTASLVADRLTKLGWQVLAGEEVIVGAAMMGVPPEEELMRHMDRALQQGAAAGWVEKMRGGKTGVVGVLQGKGPAGGPVLAIRVDMDANDVTEAKDREHRPYREGFASVNEGVMHACGHDGHTSIGLAVAEMLSALQDQFAGTVKLVFQPAEEGLRGAKAMAASGVVDDVDYMLGIHLAGANTNRTGQIACQVEGWLASTKLDAEFSGVSAHAGGEPEMGRNALLAAAAATLNLHAISRHSGGDSRINVGVFQGGSGRNVIPEHALIKFETRGTTNEVNRYMAAEAERMVRAAAMMYGVDVTLRPMGSAAGCRTDAELVRRIQPVVGRLGFELVPVGQAGGSEDYTYFMERVQAHGGLATAIRIGTETMAGAHNSRFDFNEDALPVGAAFLTAAALELLPKK